MEERNKKVKKVHLIKYSAPRERIFPIHSENLISSNSSLSRIGVEKI